jgi:hypothetical protein
MVDTTRQALCYLLYSNATASTNLSRREIAEQELLEQEKEIFLSDSLYSVYDVY